jgi:hypothetical protein
LKFAAVVLLAGAAGATFLLITNRHGGVYDAKSLPSCDAIRAKVQDLPARESDETTGTGRKCRFAGTTGKVIEFELSVSTVDDARAAFQRYLDGGYDRAKEVPPGEDAAWTHNTGDGSFCSLVVLDSNATFKIDLRNPALAGDQPSPVEPEWLCQTWVYQTWLEFYLLARGA